MIVLVLAGDDAQQGALAGAVQANHADLGAVKKAERDIAQDLLVVGREELAHPHHREDDLLICHCSLAREVDAGQLAADLPEPAGGCQVIRSGGGWPRLAPDEIFARNTLDLL